MEMDLGINIPSILMKIILLSRLKRNALCKERSVGVFVYQSDIAKEEFVLEIIFFSSQ
jgi:hypothetical protein